MNTDDLECFMARQKTYQFLRLQGFPRGSRSKRGTLGSIIAEGLREPSHISHLPGSPDIRVDRLSSPVESPGDLFEWINQEMSEAFNVHLRDGSPVYRGLRKDALAIGTVIISHPQETRECPQDELDAFVSDTTKWVDAFLKDFDMLLHYRLTHLDEKYPHLHFWFTPLPNAVREGNWVLTSLCGQGKGFYHNLQQRFFKDVGHKYFDERAKPLEDRNKRLPRHIAVQQREQKSAALTRLLESSKNPTPESISEAIETLAEQYQSKTLKLNNVILSDKAQSLIQSLGMAPSLLPDSHQYETLSNENLSLKQKLSQNNSTSFNSGGGVDISPWINELLFPVLLEVAFQQGSRADHLGEQQWLALVIEESSVALEEKLKQLGLNKEGVGAQIAETISQSGFVDTILSARTRTVEEKRQYLLQPPPSKETPPQKRGRLSSSASPESSISPWDDIIPR
jgi:hypothetical protein